MTGIELRTWRENARLSPLAAAEALGLEPWQLAAYEGGRIPVPLHIERLVAKLMEQKADD